METHELFLKQKALGIEIETRLVSIRKKNKKYRTLGYIEEQRAIIKKLWNEFDQNHSLLDSKDINKTDNYWTKGYYEVILNTYEAAEIKLNKYEEKAVEKLEKKQASPNDHETADLAIESNDKPDNKSPLNENRSQSSSDEDSTSSSSEDESEALDDSEIIAKQLLKWEEQRKFAKKMLLVMTEKASCDNNTLPISRTVIKDYWNTYKKGYVKLTSYKPEEGKQQLLDEDYHNISEVYNELLVSLELRKLSEKQNQTQVGIKELIESLKCISDRKMDIKLPKIDLPTFDGNFDKWIEFRDLFISMVHSKQITSVEKMQYLKFHLSSQAADVIKHLKISEANYDTAWTLLMSRYDNKKILINNYIKKFLALKKVEQDSANELKNLLDSSKEILYSLRNLGERIEHWDSVVIHVLTQKLPEATFTL